MKESTREKESLTMQWYCINASLQKLTQQSTLLDFHVRGRKHFFPTYWNLIIGETALPDRLQGSQLF